MSDFWQAGVRACHLGKCFWYRGKCHPLSKPSVLEIFLEVQWLRHWVPNARDVGSIPGWGTRIPHAPWPVPHQKKKDQVFSLPCPLYNIAVCSQECWIAQHIPRTQRGRSDVHELLPLSSIETLKLKVLHAVFVTQGPSRPIMGLPYRQENKTQTLCGAGFSKHGLGEPLLDASPSRPSCIHWSSEYFKK